MLDCNETPVVKMTNFPAEYLKNQETIDAAVKAVMLKGDFIKGTQVALLEGNLANKFKVNHVVACANGTDALQIALMAIDIKPGDEVIIPAFTYIAVLEVISLLGATPVLVDVENEFFFIDANLIEKVITPKTKAIVPVHLFGQCGNFQKILEIAKKYNLYVIEDCAQSLGTYEVNSQQFLGTLGHIGCTSFFPTKNLGCYGDGGALFTNDAVLAKKIKMLANHGQQQKYQHEVVGVNSRLDTLQAAILNAKLNDFDDSKAKKSEIYELYFQNLSQLSVLQLPKTNKNFHPFWNQFTIQVKANKRDLLKNYLKQAGIDSMIYYPHVLNENIGYQHIKGDFVVSKQLSKEVLALPIHCFLSKTDVLYVIDIIKEFYYGQ